MKRSITSLAALFGFILGALASPAASQSANPSQPVSAADVASGKTRIFWSTAATREIEELKSRLRRMEQEIATSEATPGNNSQLREQRLSDLMETQRRLEDATELAPEVAMIEFKGGSLKSLLAAIAESNSKVSFNIIGAGSPDVLNLELPEFSLRNSDVKTIFGVLSNLLAYRGCRLTMATGDRESPNSIVGVLQREDRTPGEKGFPAQELEALQLGDYVFEKQTVDIIVDAIRTAWKLQTQQDASQLRIQYHPGTSILLVSGPAPAQTIAKAVLQGLRKNPLAR